MRHGLLMQLLARVRGILNLMVYKLFRMEAEILVPPNLLRADEVD